MPWKDVDGNIFPNENEAREHALENMVSSDYVAFCPLSMSQIIERIWAYYPDLWVELATVFEDEVEETEREYFLSNYWEIDEEPDCDNKNETHSNYNYDEVQEEYERNAGGL